MPPKKTKKDDTEATKKKKPRKKKEPAAAQKAVKESSVSSASRSSQKGSGGMLFFFVLLIAVLVIVGVYVFQKQQTNTVSSKISELEEKLEEKLENLEEDLEKKREEEKRNEEERKQAELAATFETYTSPAGYVSFTFSKKYEIIQSHQDIDDIHKEQIVLMRTSDKEIYTESLEGGPLIGFNVYTNSQRKTLSNWLEDNALLSNVNEDTILEEVIIGDQDGYAYEWTGLGAADAVAVSVGEYVLLGHGWYVDESDTELREDFQAIVETIAFE